MRACVSGVNIDGGGGMRRNKTQAGRRAAALERAVAGEFIIFPGIMTFPRHVATPGATYPSPSP